MGIYLGGGARVKQRSDVYLADIGRAHIAVALCGEAVGCAGVVGELGCQGLFGTGTIWFNPNELETNKASRTDVASVLRTCSSLKRRYSGETLCVKMNCSALR